ncbi:sigma 54-interacting transcriptional regulator [Brevibacillus ruminantium]|uniref:HTH-type transcriptional regulatory protein TyrR n=1 Tax=Brevibacillus ruminantium TaxID=2950604 RepID=A0ABY4WNE9_9BACL|nr:sigma 54-interacting transcriptional regulator [Brevibacillus ruminantium]USG66934.1 sigma 54-interacting transcriptional regulator [Brevibacillus ruminantium]
MTIQQVWNRSFAISPPSRWKETVRMMEQEVLFVLEEEDLFVSEDQEQRCPGLLGAVRKTAPDRLVPVGVATPDEIEGREAEWGQYEIWVFHSSDGVIEGWLPTESLYRHFYRMYKEQQAYYALELETVFNTSYDMFYISDGNGITQRVSPSAERIYGYKPEELVGRSIYELEQTGVFRPSITRLVLERKEKVQVVQTTGLGGRLMVVGTPIKDEQGKVIRVVNFCRDISEERRLQSELEDARELLEGYKQELRKLSEMTVREGGFICKSEPMKQVVHLAGKLAEVDSTVLILGESGVGKEVVASFIHHNSHRRDKPYIKLNCSAIPEHLLESELFGYEKGAFTGATKEGKPGLFELANEGTLFLDEIGELPLTLQVKLLRVLQEHELVRIGGTKPVKIDVRIIAATNRNLQEETRQGRFREDLYYRLNVVPMHIPPLRERTDDILPLVLFFRDSYNKKYKKEKSFSQEALDCLLLYRWPGNVRELQNIVERLIVITDQDVIEAYHLPEMLSHAQHAATKVSVSDILPLKTAVELLERQLLTMARDKYGTTTKMAEVLGVDQSTISRKLSRIKPASSFGESR